MLNQSNYPKKGITNTTSTSGPLLDWWYVHPGYVNYDSGLATPWDVPQGVEIQVQSAEKSDPILVPELPWEDDGIAYVHTYLKDEKYQMQYLCYTGVHCIAESEDGFNWIKPELGLVKYNNSTANNIVYKGPLYAGYSFEDKSAPPSERFKMVGISSGMYFQERDGQWRLEGDDAVAVTGESSFLELQEDQRENYSGQWGQLKGYLVGATSPDRLHWTDLEKPLLSEWVDGDNIVYYDPITEQYVGYLRYHIAGRRCVGRSVSKDFRTFTPEQVILQTDSMDPPDTSFYNHAYTQYPNRTDLHLMFLSTWHQANDSFDIQLAVSHDGIQWDRPDRNTPIIPLDETTGIDSGIIYVGPGLIELPNGKWAATYWSREDTHNMQVPDGFNGTVRYAMWDKDRLCGIRALNDGSLTLRQDLHRNPEDCPDTITAPPNDIFPPLANPNEAPRQLTLNYKTEPGGWVRVELIPVIGTIMHPQFTAIKGYSFEDCTPLTGNSTDEVVTWNGEDNIAGISDTLAIRIRMFRATIFSFHL